MVSKYDPWLSSVIDRKLHKDSIVVENQCRRYKHFFNQTIPIYPLTDNKVLAISKLKAFADDNFSVAQMVQFYSDRVKNVGKGENAGFQHFLLYAQCLQKPFCLGVRKPGKRIGK